MSILKHIPRWMTNKYIIVTLVFLLFMLFLDSRNVFNQYHLYSEMKHLEKSYRDVTKANAARTQELKNLEKSYQDLNAMNANLRKELDETQLNYSEIEKVAREKYHMKRKNETVFLFGGAKTNDNQAP